MAALFLSYQSKYYMKKVITVAFSSCLFMLDLQAQGLKGLMNKVTKKDSASGKSILSSIPGTGSSKAGKGLSNDDIITGLKEALRVGTDSASKRLSIANGFFGDAAIKILMPAEAQKAEKTLRGFGLGSVVDKAVLSMNRAAEDAASGVGSIFWNSIKQMSVTDGLQILRGGDFAATDYLRKTTTIELTEKFRPVIEASLVKVDATKYWNDVFSNYNKFSATKVNPDLTAYVTEKALSGLFSKISLEEQKIRKDPAAQVTGILKSVFGGK
jgi:hypothetical protein